MRFIEGRFYKDRIPVTSHAMDIPVRLKEVNRDFFVMFNTKIQKYEIHCASQPESTLACVLPFEELDNRTLLYVREFSRERTQNLAREIEEYNERLEKKRQAELLDEAGYKTREAFNYLRNNSKTDTIPQEVIDG
jgi:AmiR/NasT family two-component response regulator